jgi:hypothetical protein
MSDLNKDDKFLREVAPELYCSSLSPPPPRSPSDIHTAGSLKRGIEDVTTEESNKKPQMDVLPRDLLWSLGLPSYWNWNDDWTIWKLKEYRFSPNFTDSSVEYYKRYYQWMEFVKVKKEQKYAQVNEQISHHRTVLNRITQVYPTQYGPLEAMARKKVRRMLREPLDILEDLREDIAALKHFFKRGTFAGF